MPFEHDLIPDDPRRAWVRVTTFEGHPASIERAMRLALEHVVPASRGKEGWQGTVGLASVDGRRGLTLSFWENANALADSHSGVIAFREGAAASGIAITDVDRYEVVFH